MKWSSQGMTRTYKLLMLTTAFALVITAFISSNDISSVPFSAFFLAIILLIILVVFWNSFNPKGEYQDNSQSSPGALVDDNNQSEVSLSEIDNKNSIPNPLDSDIDIPLM